jgi:hypothetical protein
MASNNEAQGPVPPEDARKDNELIHGPAKGPVKGFTILASDLEPAKPAAVPPKKAAPGKAAPVRQSTPAEGKPTVARAEQTQVGPPPRAPARRASAGRAWLLWGGAGVALVLSVLVALWAAGLLPLQTAERDEAVENKDGRREVLTAPPQQEGGEGEKPGTGADGFVRLFNGKNLRGWTVEGGEGEPWSAEGRTLVGRSPHWSNRSYLLTKKEYADYVLRFEFRVKSGSHGVALRAVPGEKVPVGRQSIFDHPLIKLLPAAADGKERLGTTHWVKSAESYVPPAAVPALPADGWAQMEVTVRGDHCTATIDGKPLVSLALDRTADKDDSFTPALGRVKGRVGFQVNTGTIRLRNVEIKQLPASGPDQ